MVAAALAVAFACAFIVVAVVISVDAVTNHGTIGSSARNTVGGRASPAAGVWTVAVLLTLGGVWLIRSAVRAFRRESHLAIVIPLGVLLVVGTVGEVADLLGTASGISDLVGAVILLLAAVPVVLLWPYRRQPNADAKPGERSFLGGFIKVTPRSR
jgi:asparagine N-glycosylation enzyme membrane subunit Stt3